MNVIPPGFTLSHYRLTLRPCEAIRLPRLNKGIALRGAFGSAIRALVCVDRSAQRSQCPMQQTCAYGIILSPFSFDLVLARTGDASQLILSGFGLFLSKKGGRLLIRKGKDLMYEFPSTGSMR